MARATKKKVSKKTSKKTSKKKTGKAVATKKPQLPADWKDQLRKDATEERDRVPAGAGNRVTLKRDGTFGYQGADLGESIEVIVVDHSFYRTYFDRVFDEDNPTPPACFAVKLDNKNVAPHENSPDPQAEVCEDCWANEWKSDMREKGKACREKHRVALLHAEDPDGELAMMEVPVTSAAAFRKYVKNLSGATELPSYAFLTRISMDQDAEWQKVDFECVGELDEDQMAVAYSKREQAREMILEPPDTSNYEAPKRGGGGKKKKTSKKTSKKKKKRSRVS